MKLRVSSSQIKIILVILGFVLGCLLLFQTIASWEARFGMAEVAENGQSGQVADADGQEAVFYDGQWYALKKNLETVLLIGLDTYEAEIAKESQRNDKLADFLMLLVFDHENSSYFALHINRDTMAQIPIYGEQGNQTGSFTGQLALSHIYGSGGADSCRATVKAVSEFLFGMQIDHYMSFTMGAVPLIHDLAGGVSLTLLDDFTMYDAAMKKGTEVHLTGTMALAYVSHRKELADTTNQNRMVRQRQYLKALKDRASVCMEADEGFVLKALGVIADYMVSDCTVSQLSDLCETITAYRDDGIADLAGEAIKGDEYMEFYADEELLMKTLIDFFYEPYIERGKEQK